MAKKIPETIRITPEIWKVLEAKARPFESPTEVMARLIGAEESPPRRQASRNNGVTRKSVVLEVLGGSTQQRPVAKETIEAELQKAFPGTNVDYDISNARKAVRGDGFVVRRGAHGYWLERAN